MLGATITSRQPIAGRFWGEGKEMVPGYGWLLTLPRASTIRNSWWASRMISIASAGWFRSMSRWECGFLYVPMAPAKNSMRATCSPPSALGSLSGPLPGPARYLPDRRLRPHSSPALPRSRSHLTPPTILAENHPKITIVFAHTRIPQAVTKWARSISGRKRYQVESNDVKKTEQALESNARLIPETFGRISPSPLGVLH
jgi:hypothetical protein